MTITRIIDGVERAFELTDDELIAAYREKQAEYDREDVENFIDADGEFLEEDNDLTHEQLLSLAPAITERYRHYLDNSEGWWNTLNSAAKDCVADYVKEREAEQND